jgi:hypothetical protein
VPALNQQRKEAQAKGNNTVSSPAHPRALKHFGPIENTKTVAVFHNPNKIGFSQHSQDKLMAAIRSGWAPSTLKGYSRAVNVFLTFCDDEKVDPKYRFPADEIVLCTFAASRAGRLMGATARNLMAGIQAWHIAWNIEWKGRKRLQHVLNGVEKLWPQSSQRSPRLLVTRDMVRALHRSLDLKSPLDIAIFAAVRTLFWGQC